MYRIQNAVFKVLALLCITLPCVPSASAATLLWTNAAADGNAANGANWYDTGAMSFGTLPGSGDDILIDSSFTDGTGSGTNANLNWNSGASSSVNSWTQQNYSGTVTIGTTYTGGFTQLSIANNATVADGTWTHLDNSTLQTNRLRVDVGGDFNLGSTGAIDVDGLGFGDTGGTVTGGPGSNLLSRAGGSYGGEGGRGLSGGDITVIGATYGSLTAPTDLGSTGGRSGGGRTTPGGGAVYLTVGGLMTIDGSITANALNTTDLGLGFSSGGSGGSIFLQANTFAGSGLLQSNGGDDASTSGAGGGGRIAVDLTSGTTFGSVSMEAFGHTDNSSSLTHGAAGTVYLETGTDTPGEGKIIVDNNNVVGGGTTAIPVGQTYSPSELELRNSGVLGVDAGTTLNLPNNVTSDADTNDDGIRLRQGTLNLTSGTLDIANWTLSADGVNSLTGNLTIKAGGVITHTAADTSLAMDLNLNGNLNVEAGGQINVDGKGFIQGTGDGSPGSGERGGGGFGGQGGNGTSGTGARGDTNGSVLNPADFGSGGGSSTSTGDGGGRVRIVVSGSTTVDGLISANGGPTSGAGGSGGIVDLTTGTLSGTGIIQANGRNNATNSSFGAGGGGRIVIELTSGTSFGGIDFQAFGGTDALGGGVDRRGAAGTIYLEDASQAAGTGLVQIGNNNLTTSGFTQLPALINPAGNELSEATVSLEEVARLQLTDNMTIYHLDIDGSSLLFLEGNVLTLKSFTIDSNTVTTPGIYLAGDALLGGRVFDGSTAGGYLEILAPPIPEPATGWLLGLGLFGLLKRKARPSRDS